MSFATFQHNIGYSSHYIHTFIMHRGKRGETEIGYRETWDSTTATLVLLRDRGTTPIHGTDMLRPQMDDMSTMDIYMYSEMMNAMWEPAPGTEPRSSA